MQGTGTSWSQQVCPIQLCIYKPSIPIITSLDDTSISVALDPFPGFDGKFSQQHAYPKFL
jgi:hypothetical protein